MMHAKTGTAASGLARYLAAAVLIRAANDGGAVGLALLALAFRPDLAGFLVAALVAPHLLGPWLGRLPAWADARHILAAAFSLYGAAIGVAAVVLEHAPAGVTVLVVALAGCVGPMLAGGLTSRLPSGDSVRAQALDSATWGISTAAGPAVVAVTSLAIGPRAAVVLMAGGAVLAAAVALTLPAEPAASSERVSIRACFSHAARTKPLRTILYAAGLAGLGLGALPVATPLLSVQLDEPSASGGLLVATYGLGSLVGSLSVAARPFPGPALRPAGYCLTAMAVGVGLAAAAPTYGVALAGFAGLGLANGAYLTAVQAVCRAQAPAGGTAQVLVLSSSFKITGSVLAGIWSGLAIPTGGRTILAITSICLLTAATAAIAVNRDTRSRLRTTASQREHPSPHPRPANGPHRACDLG